MASIAVAEALSVLMVTPEAHPFAKTGGLAEVSASLTDALGAAGARRHARAAALSRRRRRRRRAPADPRCGLGDRLQPVAYHERRLSDRVTLVLVDVPELFDREGLYGTADGDYPDNALRFAVFSRAALEYPRLREQRPSVIHAHDWQAGLVPVYQKMHLSSDPFVGGVPAVFTIHNLAFQGVFPAPTLPAVGLGVEVLDVQGLEFWGNISYLKGGINFSEKITTVSPGYAREIVTPELGFGFEGVLARRSADLVGILNGIDTARWTPTADPFVPASFSADDLGGKREAKRALLSVAGLPSDEAALARPLVGLVSRLTDQKGFDLIGAALTELMSLDAAWVMLGSGERRYEEAVAGARRQVSRSRVDHDRLRRAARAPHRGRRRHVPDAVPLRALRPEPDVQPALRHGADRARDRRARTIRSRTWTCAGERGPGSSSATTRPARSSRPSAARCRPFGTRPGGRQSSSGACGRTIPGTLRPGEYVKVYRAMLNAEG